MEFHNWLERSVPKTSSNFPIKRFAVTALLWATQTRMRPLRFMEMILSACDTFRADTFCICAIFQLGTRQLSLKISAKQRQFFSIKSFTVTELIYTYPNPYAASAVYVLCLTMILSAYDAFRAETFCICAIFLPRYAAILFKKQRYVSGQHKVNLKIVCKVRCNNIRVISYDW